MARDLIVRIVGDERQYRRSLDRASKASKGFERDMNRTFRGVIAGSGAFKSLGRSVAFASSAFLGGVGISAAIRSSVTAAQEEQKTLKSLEAQFRSAGVNLDKYRGRIDAAAHSMINLGIEDDEAIKTFVTLFRATGNVTESINRMQLVANLAAARHIELQKAALIVGKAESGNIGVFRRYGVAVNDAMTVQEGLNTAAAAFAGQARANVTPQEKFAAVLNRTQEIIGGALLPVMTKLLDRAAKWLDRMNQTGELQKRVNNITKQAGDILKTLNEAFQTTRKVVDPLIKSVGGLTEAIKILLSVMVVRKVLAFSGALEVLNVATLGSATSLSKAGIPMTDFRVAAAQTEARTAALAGAMRTLRVSLLAAAAAWVFFHKKQIQNKFDEGGSLQKIGDFVRNAFGGDIRNRDFGEVFGFESVNDKLKQMADRIIGVGVAFQKLAKQGLGAFTAVSAAITQAAKKLDKFIGVLPGGKKLNLAPFRLPFATQLAQARAEATKAKADDLKVARLVKEFALSIIESVEPLVESGKFSGKRLKTLREKLLAAYAALADANSTLTSAAEDSAEKAKRDAAEQKRKEDQARARRKQALEDLRAKLQDSLQTTRDQIGRLFEGPVLAPTEDQRRQALGFPGQDIGRLTQDVRAQTKLFTQFQQGLAKLTKLGAPTELIKQLRERGTSSLDQIRAILGGTAQERKALFGAIKAQNIAVQRAATMNVNAGTVNLKSEKGQPIVIHLNMDGETVTRVVTNRQQKKGRRNATQRRGGSLNVQTA